MTQPLNTLATPATLRDCEDVGEQAGWITRVRSAATQERLEFRDGPNDLSIQARKAPDIGWAAIMQPRNGTQFASPKDRDEVLRRILA